MAEQDVAARLRDFMLPLIPDEDADYIEAAYRAGDVSLLRKWAETIAAKQGLDLSEVL